MQGECVAGSVDGEILFLMVCWWKYQPIGMFFPFVRCIVLDKVRNFFEKTHIQF